MDEHLPVHGAPGALEAERGAPLAPEDLADAARGDVVIDLRDPAGAVLVRPEPSDAVVLDELPPWPEPPVHTHAHVGAGVDADVDAPTDHGAGDAGPVIEVAPADVVEVVDARPVLFGSRALVLGGDVSDGRGWVHEPAPRWRTSQLVWAVAVALVVGLVAGLVAGWAGGGGDGAASVAPVVDRTAKVVTDVGGAPSVTSAPVPVRPTGVAGPTTGPGSWQEPLPVGERATLRDPERGDLEILVIGVDDDPWPELVAANGFNTRPPANLRYVMATVAVIFRSGTGAPTFDGVSSALVFSAFGSAGREHRDTEYPVVAPLALDRSADLLDGGSVYGNLVFAIEADSRTASLRVQRTSCSAACGEVWFALR